MHAALLELLLVGIFFSGDMLVELRGFLVPGVRGVFTPLSVYPGCLVLFLYTVSKIMLDAGFLNIISRQIVLFAYLTASAFFDSIVDGR